MTSINAIRFNRHQGAMVCDEIVSTDGGLGYAACDKILPCIPAVVRDTYGIVAGLGTTGTCSVGDTLKAQLHDWVLATYRAEVDKLGHAPARFMNLERMTRGVFDLMVAQKHQWVSERLRGEFGFDVAEFIAGSYERDGQKYEIKDREIVKQVTDWLSWKNGEAEVQGIFLNAGLFAGYDDDSGFQIFHIDFRDGYWHQVQNCYFAEGSGRQSVDPGMYGFVERLRIDERRGNIDPIDGLIAMLAAVNSACDHEVGVGGYPSVMLFDGREPNTGRLREFTDDRSWLAACAVRAFTTGYLEQEVCRRLVEGLFYKDDAFESAYQGLWSSAREPAALGRMLRGYKVPPFAQLRKDRRPTPRVSIVETGTRGTDRQHR